MAVEGVEDAPGRLDADDEHRVGLDDLLHDGGEGLAAGQAIDMLDGLDLAMHRALQGIVLMGFAAKGAEPIGDQPGGRGIAAQALLDVIQVAIAQRAQEAPHGNPRGAGLLGDAVGGLEGQLLEVGQQVGGDALAGGGQACKLLFQGDLETVLVHDHLAGRSLEMLFVFHFCISC